MAGSPAKRNYALVCGSYLPASETFVYGQMTGCERWTPVVLARDLVPTRALFPFPKVVSLSLPERVFWFAARRSPRFSAAIRREGAEFVHAHFGTNGALAFPTARRLGLPLVTTLHGVDVGVLLSERVPGNYRWYAKIARDMLDGSALLLPASSELAEAAVSLGADPEKVRVHRLGVDLAGFRAADRPDRPARFLMIGRFVEKKGFEYGIRAFAKIAGEIPGSTMRLVGTGALDAELRRLAADLGVADRVEFLGVLPQPKVAAELEACDVLVAPCVVARNGDRDSGLIVLKEAAATAMPAVATICGGLPEIVDDGATGFLAKQRDVDGLAEPMLALARDPGLRARMGRAARAKMEREYDARVQNARLEALFDSLF